MTVVKEGKKPLGLMGENKKFQEDVAKLALKLEEGASKLTNQLIEIKEKYKKAKDPKIRGKLSSQMEKLSEDALSNGLIRKEDMKLIREYLDKGDFKSAYFSFVHALEFTTKNAKRIAQNIRAKKLEEKQQNISAANIEGNRVNQENAVVVNENEKQIKQNARKEKHRSEIIQKVKKPANFVKRFCPECAKEMSEFFKAMEEGRVKDALALIKRIRKKYAERLKKKKPKVFAALDKMDKLLTGFVKDFGKDMAQNPERERKLNALAWRSNSFNDYITAAHNQNLISDAVFQAARTLIPTLPTATLTPQQVAKINKIVNAYIKQRSLKELADIYDSLDDITHSGRDADQYYEQLRQKYQPVYAGLEAGLSADELKKLIEAEEKRREQEEQHIAARQSSSIAQRGGRNKRRQEGAAADPLIVANRDINRLIDPSLSNELKNYLSKLHENGEISKFAYESLVAFFGLSTSTQNKKGKPPKPPSSQRVA